MQVSLARSQTNKHVWAVKRRQDFLLSLRYTRAYGGDREVHSTLYTKQQSRISEREHARVYMCPNFTRNHAWRVRKRKERKLSLIHI